MRRMKRIRTEKRGYRLTGMPKETSIIKVSGQTLKRELVGSYSNRKKSAFVISRKASSVPKSYKINSSAQYSLTIYGSILNQEEKDINKTIKSLDKYI